MKLEIFDGTAEGRPFANCLYSANSFEKWLKDGVEARVRRPILGSIISAVFYRDNRPFREAMGIYKDVVAYLEKEGFGRVEL